MTHYSIVTPAHNEAGNLPTLIEKIASVLDGKIDYNIVIVNDNSTDNSGEVLAGLQKKYKQLDVVTRTKLGGVGYAIREGLYNAKGDFIITMDGDLSHKPEQILDLLAAIKDKGLDMVCGSRYVARGASDMHLSRKIISRGYNVVFGTLLGLKVRDFTSGFRIFKRDFLENIKFDSTGFGIYVEILMKAHLAGYKIGEIPISYDVRGEGESNLNYFEQGPEYCRVALKTFKHKLFK